MALERSLLLSIVESIEIEQHKEDGRILESGPMDQMLC